MWVRMSRRRGDTKEPTQETVRKPSLLVDRAEEEGDAHHREAAHEGHGETALEGAEGGDLVDEYALELELEKVGDDGAGERRGEDRETQEDAELDGQEIAREFHGRPFGISVRRPADLAMPREEIFHRFDEPQGREDDGERADRDAHRSNEDPSDQYPPSPYTRPRRKSIIRSTGAHLARATERARRCQSPGGERSPEQPASERGRS